MRPENFEVLVEQGRTPVAQVAAGAADEGAEAFAARNRDALLAVVAEHGAVLVRGTGLRDAAELGAIGKHLSGTLLTEREGLASRSAYAENVYSSSKWPADQPMCMHHELSYASEVPGLMLFGCLTPPASGGATAVADARKMLAELPAELVERFETTGWTLTRNYGELVGVPLAEAFGDVDRAAVEEYCRRNGIEHEWTADGALSTSQRRAAVVTHPATGERCWFNQIAFLNEWTMDPDVRDYLTMEFGPSGLPFNTAHGDGEPIGEDVVARINALYEANTLREPWQAGDVLLVDNIRMAHSREAYTGDREVVVVMADPVAPPLPG
ncbi:TauD/TfdA family dioxygenase [Saccharopolyspora pogona]|uniref:TauD/TfdA family dioxygenase n=1 Tax=Saccharopolyspora pogona TaxID=333966 RepID=UPI001682754A|nr:TauD/TfdA family dioxygenase [Saccharopolyspora pogona]